MKNLHFFPTLALFLFFLAIAIFPIYGKNRTINLSKTRLNEGVRFITPINSESFSTKGNNIYKSGKVFFKSNDDLIMNITPIIHQEYLFVLSTINLNQSTTVNYSLISQSGTLLPLKTISIPFDQSVPIFHSLDDSFILLQPEDQSYTIIDFSGQNLIEAQRLNESEWSSEKTLFYTTWNGSHFLVGMTFADYQNHTTNGELYQLDSSLNPKFKVKIPVSLPLHVKTSQNGLCAIVGIKKFSKSSHPMVEIVFIDLNNQYKISHLTLEENPKSILWHNRHLILLGEKEIISIDPTTEKEKLIPYEDEFKPIEMIAHKKSIYILGCKSVDITKNGPIYNTAILLELKNFQLTKHIIEHDSFKHLSHISIMDESSIIIQGDQNIYTIETK